MIGTTYRRHISLRHDRYQSSTSDQHHATYLIDKSFPPKITSCHITTLQRILSIPLVTLGMQDILSQIQITFSHDIEFTRICVRTDHTLSFILGHVTVYPLPLD
jgi:hypothetical protein